MPVLLPFCKKLSWSAKTFSMPRIYSFSFLMQHRYPQEISHLSFPMYSIPWARSASKDRREASTYLMQHWAGRYCSSGFLPLGAMLLLLLPLCLLPLQLVSLERGRKYHLAAYGPYLPSYLGSHDGEVRTQNIRIQMGAEWCLKGGVVYQIPCPPPGVTPLLAQPTLLV